MADITTTIGSVQNISGQLLVYERSNDWQGSLGGLGTFPTFIAVNETATFQHVGNENGSQGAVVYHINDIKAFDVVIAWFNSPNVDNKAYTLIDQPGAFTIARWPAIFEELTSKSKKKSTSTRGQYTSTVEIGDGNFPTFIATIVNNVS